MACKECIHRKLCKKFANPFDYDILESVGCDDFKHSQPQTNADRIRAMSDEELAEFLESTHNNMAIKLSGEYIVRSKEYIAIWLKQPADMRGEEDGK